MPRLPDAAPPEAPSTGKILPPEPSSAPAVTPRSVLLCLILLPLTCWWQVNMEMVRNTAHPTTLSLFFHVVLILLFLTLASRALGKIHPCLALARAELLFTYTILTIGAAVCGSDFLQILVPALTSSFKYAGAANDWERLLNPNLPPPLFVSEPILFAPYWEGRANVFASPYFLPWLRVISLWTVFFGTLLWTMLCMSSVLRKAWTDNERLTYPIIQLPLQITDENAWTTNSTGLAGNRLFWIGFAIAGTIDMVNSLNVYFPQIPPILTPGEGVSQWDIGPLFTTKPWNALGETPLTFYPFLIGLGMLLPLDFLFSIFVFYWFWKLQKVASVVLALDQTQRFPYIENQAFGAYLTFCLGAIWINRNYLKAVWRTATRTGTAEHQLDDRHEPMPYRVAVFGALAGGALLVGFATYLGMRWWVAVVYFAIYFLLALAVTRMRAELGAPFHDLHFTGPEMILTRVLGTRTFPQGELTAMGVLFCINRAYRSHPMPPMLEGYKLAEQGRADFRQWTIGVAILQTVAVFVAFWAIVAAMYRWGAAFQVRYHPAADGYNAALNWINNPTPPNAGEFWAIVVGGGVAALLQWLRVAVAGFPLHPLAFAISSSFQVNLVWLPLTMACIIKAILLRFGGLRAFRASLPFFYGLMLGQFVVGGLWNVVGMFLDIPTYKFWD